MVHGQADVEPDRPLDRLHDFEQRGRPVALLQFEAARVPAVRNYQPRTCQILQHFREKLLRALRRGREIRPAHPSPLR